MAAHYGSENVTRLLINYGADVNLMAKVSCTVHLTSLFTNTHTVCTAMHSDALRLVA